MAEKRAKRVQLTPIFLKNSHLGRNIFMLFLCVVNDLLVVLDID